jgi:hypothetical protein
MSQWPFDDPPNLAVVSHRTVIFGQEWIALVSHDADDGGWQFLSHETSPLKESDGVVVSLREIVQIDPSVAQLADLPLGWRAWRGAKNSLWHRAKTRDPTSQKWLAAGIALGNNPEAQVRCPECDHAYLASQDVELSNQKTARIIRCPKCGRYEELLGVERRGPTPVSPTA